MKTSQGEVDLSWERNKRDQGHTQNVGDEKDRDMSGKGAKKIIRAFWNRKDAQHKRHFWNRRDTETLKGMLSCDDHQKDKRDK